MRSRALIAMLLLCSFSSAKDRKNNLPLPTQFEIGRLTFFDFGPPFNYYEVMVVRPGAQGSAVERLLLTPATDACFRPPTIETASANIRESIAELLQGTNPCTIPEKELRRERRRCKHCLVFSGAVVAMRVQCGSTTRIIRSDILDRDMFDAHPQTPEHTSWTMGLLSRLDHAVGPGVMEKPIFVTEDSPARAPVGKSETLSHLANGEFDGLFNGRDKVSELYRAAQAYPKAPEVELIESSPFKPESSSMPAYPGIAKTAHVSGTVVFTASLDANAAPTTISFRSGPPMLYSAVKDAVSKWSFPKDAAGQQVEVSIQFNLNCPAVH